MPGEDRMLLIRNYDLWCHLSDEEYRELKVQHHVIDVPKGEYIYFEAYNHNKIYFVKEGTIKIGYIDQEGNEKIKEIIQKGELFGQFGLERSNLHGEFAQAYKNDVSICAFTIDDFERLPDELAHNHELVDGKLVDVSGNTGNHNALRDLLIRLLYFVQEQKLGRVLRSTNSTVMRTDQT